MRVHDPSVSSLGEARNAVEYADSDRERLEVFLASLSDPLAEEPYLAALEADCLRRYLPVIRKPLQRFLAFLLASLRPERILEIGTAVGFSAIFMAKCCETAEIVTIENSEERAAEAEQHIREAGCGERITVLSADAGPALQKLTDGGEKYDLIFLDGPKGQYGAFLPLLKQMMHPAEPGERGRKATVLLTDDVLMEGALLKSRVLIPRRNRTIYKRMRAFLRHLSDDPELSSVILPVGDGIALTVRKASEDR